MSDSQVIARKFRPSTFDQVVGQEAITRTLANAIESGRLHHAYLFAGARGVGKTTTARILAKALNCQKGVTTEPCGVCPSCVDIANSTSIDVLEIDAASNTGVDNVRDSIINTVAIAPAHSRYKVFIIDEVHQLSSAAFNALLKTLEEPPGHVVFIMATTELHKVPETILSRCQVFEFRTIAQKKIFEQLQRIADNLGVQITESALSSIARAGEGSMRDAESAFDQVISFAGKIISDEDVSTALGLVGFETLNRALQAVADQDSSALIRMVDDVVSRGYDLRNFCREMMTHIRGLLVIKVAGFDPELLEVPQGEAASLTELAGRFSEQDLIRFFAVLTKTEQDIRISSQPRFQLEIGLMKLVQSRRLFLLEEALNKLSDLQTRLGAGGAPQNVQEPRPDYSTAQRTPRPSAISPVRGQSSTGSPPASKPRTAASSTASKPARPAASMPPAMPPEPPPLMDEPADLEPMTPVKPAPSGSEVDRIKAELEARMKMILVMDLNRADSIHIEGTRLVVSYPPSEQVTKSKLESRENRTLIEEACQKALGRKLTLKVTIGAGAPSGGQADAEEEARNRAASHPAVQAIVRTFHGEVTGISRIDEEEE